MPYILSKKENNNFDGFITIFVSVVLTCIIAIILVLTEGARMRASKLYYRIANNCAIDSMFSLYHLPLWEYYHLLGIEFKDEEMLKDEFYNYLKVHSQDENDIPIENWFGAKLEKNNINLKQEALTEKSNLTNEINDYTKVSLIGKSINFLATNINIDSESDIDKMGDILKSAFMNMANTSSRESKQLAKISKEYNLEKELSNLNILLTNISKTIAGANDEIRNLKSSRTYTTFNAHAKCLLNNINTIYQSINVFLEGLEKTNERLNNLRNKFQIDKISLSKDGITIIEEQLSIYQDALDSCLEQNGTIETINTEASYLQSFLTSMIEEIEGFIESIKELSGSEKSEAKREFNEYIRDVADSIDYLTYFDFNQGINEEERNKYSNLIDFVNSGLVSLVMPDSANISNTTLSYANHELEKISNDTSLIDKALLNEYSFEHFNYLNKKIIDESEAKTLSNRLEIEYLISGKNSDYESIKECINELFLTRSGLNLIYLYTNHQSRQEALSLASLIAPAAPLLVPVIQFTLLLAWSSAQSIVDIRNLLNCKRVPIMHNESSFTLSLTGATNVLSNYLLDDNENGLNYKDYLRILLYTKCLMDQKEIFRRIINVIEYNIKNNIPNRDYIQPNFNFQNLSYALDATSVYKTWHVFSNLNFLNLFTLGLWKDDYEIKIETTNSYANSILRGN